MQFVLRMAFRELRSSWRRLAFFFICVAIGVGAIVALRSLIQNVRAALTAEARTLTAGDVYLRSDQPWTDEILQVLERRLEGVTDVEQTETLDTTTMVRLTDEESIRTKVVELRGVQAEFPFYGEFALGGGQPYSFDLLRDQGVLVGPELLTQLGLAVGDPIMIGEVAFTIRDVILSEPGRQLGAFSSGPRVLVDRDALESTGLLNYASRANRQILLKVDEAQMDALVIGLREDLADAFVRVGSYRHTENRIERNLSQTENYLSLIGFVVVILGGIGVWSVTRVFVQQRLRSVAILKCLGATTGRVLSVYVAQVLMLGLGGSLLGVGLAQAALAAVPESLTDQAATSAGLAIVSTDLTGSAMVQGVRSLQANLLSNFALELRDDTPDMFLIDIQQDQADGVQAMLEASVHRPAQMIPVLRARVNSVNGRDLRVDGVQAARRAGLGREYMVTYRSHLEENERVIAGTFWDDQPATEPEVSIEQSLREERDIQLGDVVGFDVLGREIRARVTSVRSVEWEDPSSGGFMFLFRPGVFDDAPHTYIAFMRGPPEAETRARLQRDIAGQYPNVSVIDGLEVLKTVRRVLEYVTLAINVVGTIALFSGGLILVGSVAMTKFQRVYEAAIFKTLGAKTRVLATMLIIEYGVLGILAGSVGSVGALVLTWALTRQVFDITWFPAPLQNVGGIVVTATVVGIVGVVSSLDVLRRKPLATLRAE